MKKFKHCNICTKPRYIAEIMLKLALCCHLVWQVLPEQNGNPLSFFSAKGREKLLKRQNNSQTESNYKYSITNRRF
jgi:hypothetical protein